MGKEYKSLISEITLVCEKNLPFVKKQKISDSRSAYEFINPLWPVDITHREAAMAIYLNRANNTVGYATIGIGGVAGTAVDGKLVFQNGLMCNASCLILVHNHPSGNLQPSRSDIDLTQRLVNFGRHIEMEILDHLIITEDGYYSLADEGLIN